jgi:DNA processing protein
LNRVSKDILALSLVPGLGPRRIMTLAGAVNDTEEIFSMPDGRLAEILGRGFKHTEKLRSIKQSREYAEELEYIESENITVLCFKDEGYPDPLRDIYDPPPVIFYKGEIKAEDLNAVAIVGSRRASTYGIRMAQELSKGLVEKGVTVISGLARGIDLAAHQGALSSGGRTLAVMGTGFRHVYPPEASGIVPGICASGAVITEYASKTAPTKISFPRRNRIISALSRGVVIVEAAEKSGALITADFALEQGKEVFAVPGRADISTSKGTNSLIQQGAKLVTCAEEILEEIDASSKNAVAAGTV